MSADQGPSLTEVREAVEENYTEEGQRIWWAAWRKADAEKRAHMERVICTESGGT